MSETASRDPIASTQRDPRWEPRGSLFVRILHYVAFTIGGGLMFGLGSRDEVPLYAAVPMLMVGWKMISIGCEKVITRGENNDA